MKNQVITSILLVFLILLSGCGTETTGGVTKDVCDNTCQQARDDYLQAVNTLLSRAEEITAKVEDWKTVTKQDLTEIISKKEQLSALTAPNDFEMIHDYYGRAFNHYVKAMNYVVEANEYYASASDPANIQSRNALMSNVVNNIQEANKLLIYADEEVKFATRLVSKD